MTRHDRPRTPPGNLGPCRAPFHAQDGPQTAQDGPKRAPKMAQDGPKMASGGPREGLEKGFKRAQRICYAGQIPRNWVQALLGQHLGTRRPCSAPDGLELFFRSRWGGGGGRWPDCDILPRRHLVSEHYTGGHGSAVPTLFWESHAGGGCGMGYFLAVNMFTFILLLILCKSSPIQLQK